MILNIETSTDVCSVALSENGVTVSHLEIYDGNAHAANLTPLIERIFASQSDVKIADIEAVAVSSGPGSYTGLRIGASTAKGICYALGKPLIAVPTLDIIAEAIFLSDSKIDIVCPMIDARRMEVYTQVVRRNAEVIVPVEALVVDENAFANELSANVIAFGGNGAAKCQKVITSANAVFVPDICPLASNMARLAQKKFDAREFESVAYFEPFYLKEFIATVPKNKVF